VLSRSTRAAARAAQRFNEVICITLRCYSQSVETSFRIRRASRAPGVQHHAAEPVYASGNGQGRDRRIVNGGTAVVNARSERSRYGRCFDFRLGPPPAQIRASEITALGSHLGFDQRSDPRDMNEALAASEGIVVPAGSVAPKSPVRADRVVGVSPRAAAQKPLGSIGYFSLPRARPRRR
jgi:hypothetical protein